MNTGFAKSTGNTIGVFLEALLLFLIAVAGQASIAAAQSGGTFTATGSMSSARVGHTATLLPNGKVLIAGGTGLYFSSLSLTSAELYDPATGTYTVTGDMTTGRSGHTAALLPDGQVLIVGGASGGATVSAELYDPGTGVFTSAGNAGSRVSVTTALLNDGKVLIIETGSTTGGVSFPTFAELYDPSTGTFTATGNMIVGHLAPTATLLPNGKVLVSESVGFIYGGTEYGAAEIYDPVAGTFSLAGDQMLSTAGGTSTLLTDGKVLLAGGYSDGGALSGAVVYDSSTGIFTVIGNMTTGRFSQTASLLPDGTVLIAGGGGFDFKNLASAEIYDPRTGAFAAAGNMISPRLVHTATLLDDGRVLIAGGLGQVGTGRYLPQSLGTAELYTSCSVNNGATCPPDPWQQAIAQMKASAGTDSLSFWQWAWYWQNTPAFDGAPAGFGVAGSISSSILEQIIADGGGDPFLNVSAEQWVLYFRQVAHR
jgi:WD40 repeat protein